MANTSLYSSLESRVSELRINMLPETFDAIEGYDTKTLDLTKGYMLLVHSEIEHYIESICHKFIDLQVTKYWEDKAPSACALALITYSKLEWEVSNEETNIPTITSSSTKKTVGVLLKIMLKSYNIIVNSNHGIKTNNLQKLIAPTGMIEHFPDIEMENFNSFGGHRGELAHLSTSHLRTEIDPEDQYNKLTNNLLPALQAFDQELVANEPKLSLVNWSEVKPGELNQSQAN